MSREKTDNLDEDQQIRDASLQNVPYSIFTRAQKRWIVLCIAFAGMFSPLSSFIYYPAINSLAMDLGTSIEAVNLSITTYMIVSGITPSILGDAADQIGRRPAYVFAFSLYIVANIGLALQKSYPALLVLRMIQSVGSSGTIAIAYGVVADIAPSSERGSYIGAVLCGPNLAPGLGPVLGAVLAARAGWRWIFWFLCIIGSVCLAAILLFLPETARKVVGNGSIPTSGINLCLPELLRQRSHRDDAVAKKDRERRKLHIPNPMKCLYIVFYRDTAVVLYTNAAFYVIYCCSQASLSSSFISIYHYGELEAGLIYLPFGFGCALASYGSGKLMDRDYRIVARQTKLVIGKSQHDDLSTFPVEKARLRSIWYLLVVAVASIAAYGWAVQKRIHVALPLILQFLIGTSTTGIFNICGTLLVDLHPQCPSTVSASSNLVRCSLAAASLAVLQIMIDHIGIGWCFTLFATIAATTIPLLFVERTWGMRWRSIRDRKTCKNDGGMRRENAGREADTGHHNEMSGTRQ